MRNTISRTGSSRNKVAQDDDTRLVIASASVAIQEVKALHCKIMRNTIGRTGSSRNKVAQDDDKQAVIASASVAIQEFKELHCKIMRNTISRTDHHVTGFLPKTSISQY